eukprot:3817250-Prymnesium_polylepis.1
MLRRRPWATVPAPRGLSPLTPAQWQRIEKNKAVAMRRLQERALTVAQRERTQKNRQLALRRLQASQARGQTRLIF